MSRIRVLVADDSMMFRRVLTRVISGQRDMEVVGRAVDGIDVVAKVKNLRPDAITLDVEMPRCNGLDAIPRIRDVAPGLPIIMVSSLTQEGATATLEALARGASCYVGKPTTVADSPAAVMMIEDELIPKIRALAQPACAPAEVHAPRGGGSRPTLSLSRSMRSSRARASGEPVRALAIGSATGGPLALKEVLGALPERFPIPTFIVQHMPATFTRTLAERLSRSCPLTVVEAEHDQPAEAGYAYIAPGDFHMRVARRDGVERVALDQEHKVHFARPAVDPLFTSVAETYGSSSLGVVLTGMGRDGAAGARAIRDVGGAVLIQDRESSVVWSMPKAVHDAGAASGVLPASELGRAIVRRVVRVAAFGQVAPAHNG